MENVEHETQEAVNRILSKWRRSGDLTRPLSQWEYLNAQELYLEGFMAGMQKEHTRLDALVDAWQEELSFREAVIDELTREVEMLREETAGM